MIGKEFWFYFTDNCKKHFEQEFLLKNKNFSLAVLYGKYYEKFLFEEGKKFNFDDRDKLLYKDKFLICLENLLKKGELKMELNKLIFSVEEAKHELENNFDTYTKEHIKFLRKAISTKMGGYYYITVGTKYFDNKNYKEGIGRLKNEWYKIKDEEQRRVFEDGGVFFALPENKFYSELE